MGSELEGVPEQVGVTDSGLQTRKDPVCAAHSTGERACAPAVKKV